MERLTILSHCCTPQIHKDMDSFYIRDFAETTKQLENSQTKDVWQK
jgi:hypothetical protein